MFGEKKYLSLTLVVIIFVTIILGSSSLAVVSEELNIKLRVEGISENLFYDEVSVESTGDLTVKDFLESVNEQYPDLNIEGLDTGFISGVKGESSSYFGGWDGWYYLVNMVAPSVGVSDYVLENNDSIILYYSDMATQRPIIDLSDIKNGNIKFTSADVTYDDDWNEIININPVVDATVTIATFDDSFVTDDNGVISVGEISKGEYAISIEKYAEEIVNEKSLPLVLRFAPDYSITVDNDYPVEDELTEPGDSSLLHFGLLSVLSMILVFVSIRNKANRES